MFVREDGAIDPDEGGYGRSYIRSLDGSLLPFEDFIKVDNQGFESVSTVPVQSAHRWSSGQPKT